MDLLTGLNPAQVEAVSAADGPVLVLAGPGSGKTRVLTHRIARLVRENGVYPYHILAVTFTNKAAREMLARLELLLGADAKTLTIGTFHAVCARFLRREAALLGLDRSYTIYDADDQLRLISRVIKELRLDPQAYKPSAVLGAISNAKNELLTPQTYTPPTYWHEAVLRAYESYENHKRESGALDFDDLLMRTEELLRAHPDVLARYQRQYSHLLVDEFQDTNKAQYEIIKLLAGKHRNLFVVGDEDQSIYRWRGADYRNVLRFRQEYPDARVILLEQNYRSTRKILEAAQAVINRNQHRTEKKLWTENADGRPVQLFEAYDENEEAEFVAGEIQRASARRELRPGQCAVMYRTNAQSRPIEDMFMRKGIPYRLIGGTRFYQRREVKDILAYLRLVHNPRDDISLARIINIPARQIGDKTLRDLAIWASDLGLSQGEALVRLGTVHDQAAKLAASPFRGRSVVPITRFAEALARWVAMRETHSVTELIRQILDDTEYLDYLRDGTEEGSERIANVQELYSVTQRYDMLEQSSALATFLEEVALVSDADELDQGSEAVTLLTLHLAKGLEFDAVFMIGMEEGLCPHSRSIDNPDELEEERRLCYVGMTRARKRLYLVRAVRRTLYGSSDVRDPSRFLLDIPPRLVEGNPFKAAIKTPDVSPRNGSSPERTALYAVRKQQVERTRAAHNNRVERPATPRPMPKEPRMIENYAPVQQLVNREAAFHTGDKIYHNVFGEGTVIASRIVGDDEEVSVVFQNAGLKRLMASFARLERR